MPPDFFDSARALEGVSPLRGNPATELAFFRESARGRWFSLRLLVSDAGALAVGFAGCGCGVDLALFSSARFSHGLTVGGAAGCNTTGFGGGGAEVSFRFFSPLFFSALTVVSLDCEFDWRSLRSTIQAGSDSCDFVSHVVSEDEPVAGADDASSSFVVVLADAAMSGDDTPDAEWCDLSSDLARSTGLAFTCAPPVLCSCAGFCASAFLSPTLASTSSAQLPPVANSEKVPVAGVAASGVALLGGAGAFAAGALPFAAWAYENPVLAAIALLSVSDLSCSDSSQLSLDLH